MGMAQGVKPALRLSGISKSYGKVRALENLSFDVAAGRFFVLFGPSSVGKTTTLRTIAGLVRPDSGRLESMEGLYPEPSPARRVHGVPVLRALSPSPVSKTSPIPADGKKPRRRNHQR